MKNSSIKEFEILKDVKYIFLFIIFTLVIAGCEEPFDRPQDLQGDQVVIYGRVSNLVEDTYVEVGMTRNTISKPKEIDGVAVYISDEEGSITEFCEKSAGVYVPLDPEFKGIVGTSYNLTVTLPDGREYFSNGQEILPPTVMDSAYADFVKKEVIRETENASTLNFLELSVDADFQDISEEKFVRWDIQETFTILQTALPGAMRFYICFISQEMSLQRVNLISTASITTPQIRGIYLGDRLVDYAFGVKHATEFFQRTISEETYNYWSEIDKVATVSGSIFDSPPAPVFGNITSLQNEDEVVLGYFEATGSELRRIFTFGAEMEEPQQDPCSYAWFKPRYPGYCLDCLSHPNSSYEFEEWYVTSQQF